MALAFFWGGLAAASLLIGYFLAWRGLSQKTIGLIMAVGAGALISAIAYELIPESKFDTIWMALFFAAGALAFFGADWLIDSQGGSKRKGIRNSENSGSGPAIFIGTLMDNIPESIILGLGLATGGVINISFMVAVFISNLPEGLAGTVNLASAGYSKKRIFWMETFIVVISAFCALLGYYLVKAMPTIDGRYLQAFAAGAMLTMLADAMMPEAFRNGGKLAGIFTVLGFLLAAMLSIAQ
jgi:zinc transporter, ZIP family